MKQTLLFASFARAGIKQTRFSLGRAQCPRWLASIAPVSQNGSIPSDTLPRLRKGDQIDIEITRLAYGGASVGRIVHPSFDPEDADIPVYAPKGACPGDMVRCVVQKVRRRRPDPEARAQHSPRAELPNRTYADAIFLEPLSTAETALQPPCKHFGNFRLGGGGCGGCTSMQLPYELQLQQKQQQLESLYASLSSNDRVDVEEILPSEQTFRFRNKMEFSFGRRWLDSSTFQKHTEASEEQLYALGLHAPQRFDKIVQIDECHLQPEPANDVLRYIRTRSAELHLEPYDTKLGTGYLRNIAIRTARNSNNDLELMVNIITGPCEVPGRLIPLAQELMGKFPSIVCVVQNIRGVQTSVEVDEAQQRLLAGSRNFIEQTLCSLNFRISANSFFQTNPFQAEVLYEAVRSACKLTKRDSVLDLFCGTGTIGLCLSPYAKHVHGVDIVASAIQDARVNASSNHIQNATFVEGNLEKLKKEGSLMDHYDVDVIIVDPPRAGLHPDLLKFIVKSTAKRIVYVSCNPASQVRDIHLLREHASGKFRVTQVQPVDMFPHTHHVECVTTLERDTTNI